LAKLLVGIDIGSGYTKVVVLEQAVKIHLKDGFIFPTPIKAEKDGSKHIDVEALHSQFDIFLSVKKLHAAQVAVNLSTESITALSVFLPVMPAKELSFAAIGEAKQKMIPVTVPSHIFEFINTGEVSVNNAKRAEVLVIRTDKHHVQRIIDVFKSFDVSPVLISPPCTLLPGIVPKEIWKKDESIVFVDIGASSLTISICRDGNMVFMRSIVYGIRDITKDLSHQLGIDEPRMGQVLREMGIPEVAFDLKDKVALAEEIMRQKYEASQNGESSGQNQVNSLELRMLWQPHIDRIAQELRRSFVFYKEQPDAGRIERLYFLGGGSSIKSLIPVLSSSIGGEYNFVLPFKDLQYQIPDDCKFKDELIGSPIFANSASLALNAGIAQKAKKPLVNFLPVELKKKHIIATRRIIFLVTGICIFVLFGGLSLQLLLSNVSLKRGIKKIEQGLEKVKSVSIGLNELVRTEQDILQRKQQIADLMKKMTDYPAELRDLMKAVPGGLLLKKCVLSSNKIEIEASVFADYEEANKIIGVFKERLQKITYFQNIQNVPIELEEIVPKIEGNAEPRILRLTQVKNRTFTLSADIIKNN
jgi:type IV pilus assembly protein PilM